ncbi:MAG: hypothetical protein FRX49_12094 [Trebouxia sp. A1-2]|nr:MAG: hypothetical protein FRX49_12094 [Trebouxia sp. A1-2]
MSASIHSRLLTGFCSKPALIRQQQTEVSRTRPLLAKKGQSVGFVAAVFDRLWKMACVVSGAHLARMGTYYDVTWTPIEELVDALNAQQDGSGAAGGMKMDRGLASRPLGEKMLGGSERGVSKSGI